MVSLPVEIRMLYFNKFKDNIARGALHSLVSHVRVPEIRITLGARSYFKSEFFDSRNDFLRMAEMALPTNYLSFALTTGTNLSVKIVVSSSELYSPCNSALSSAFLASDDIVGIFSSCSFAMRTCYLLFN